MKPIDELLGMSVLTLKEGARLGSLRGVEIDPLEGRVRYLRFAEHGRREGYIPWEAVHSIGADAITVRSAGDARETLTAVEREGLTSQVGDRPAMTESGTQLGTVTSYDLDPASGKIASYHIRSGGFLGVGTQDCAFPHASIRAFGNDAIILDDSVIERKAA